MARTLLSAARQNFHVVTGSYAGTGAMQNITGLPSRPRFLLIKGGANSMAIKTDKMGLLTGDLGVAASNFTGGVLDFLANGFTLGTDVHVNAAATTYYYLAIMGTNNQDFFRTVSYTGNGADSRAITAGIGFQPDFVMIKSAGGASASGRSSAVVGDNSFHFSAASDGSDEIQALLSTGFEVGLAARVNTAAAIYHAMVLKNHGAGANTIFASGSYVGDGADDRTVSIGFQPDWVIIKDTGPNSAAFRTTAYPANTSSIMSSSADATTRIKSFTPTGFTVGTSIAVNANASTYWWMAGVTGSFNLPLNRALASGRGLATNRNLA